MRNLSLGRHFLARRRLRSTRSDTSVHQRSRDSTSPHKVATAPTEWSVRRQQYPTDSRFRRGQLAAMAHRPL